jgi:hypothetical protein
MRIRALLMSAAFVAGAGAALAQGAPPPAPEAEAAFDPLFCTVTSANLCTGDACAKTETFGELKLPTKLLIHFDRKIIASSSDDGFPHVSPIGTLAAAGEGLILQGIDGASGWMIHLSRSDPKMTFAIASSTATLTGAGNCGKGG